MQMTLSFAQDGRFPEILDRLSSSWPIDRTQQSDDPLTQLIYMVVSKDTAGAIALAAFHRLRQRYHRWHDLKNAQRQELIGILRGVDRFAHKADLLPAMLKVIESEHGLLELDFLGDWSNDQARAFLETLPGVDATISAATLNFSTLRRTVLSVTAETARPLRRLGLAPSGSAFSALDRHIVERMPGTWTAKHVSDLHKGLEQLARHVCHDAKPTCGQCPLKELCPTGRQGTGDVLSFPKRQCAGEALSSVHTNKSGNASKNVPSAPF